MPDAILATCRDCARDVVVSPRLVVITVGHYSTGGTVTAGDESPRRPRRAEFTFPCCGAPARRYISPLEAAALLNAGALTVAKAGERLVHMIEAYLSEYARRSP